MIVSHTRRFTLWKFYRTAALPAAIAAAMLSMLYAGVLPLVHTISELALRQPAEIRQVFVAFLSVASGLMFLHAVYLSLMAFHLVYRFPIEQIRPIALVYLLEEEVEIHDVPRPPEWPQGFAWVFEKLDVDGDRIGQLLDESKVIHMSHHAYDIDRVNQALRVLEQAREGTLLLLRYTSNVSFYRVISASTSCSYIHHHMHPLLIRELLADGWKPVSGVPDQLLVRYCPIDEGSRKLTTEWIEAQYGEFSAM